VMGMLKLGRRRFLSSAAFAGGIAIAPVGLWALLTRGTSDDPVAAALVRLLDHKESAMVVGRGYLAMSDHRTESETDLVERICCGEGFTANVLRSQKRAKTWLRERVQADFESGRTVRLDGWILAETEVRLCALAVLAHA